MRRADRSAWVRMRMALWPEADGSGHIRDIERILAGDNEWAFVAESSESEPVAFAEVALRKYANGCESQPVPFLEGIWVDERFRRAGVGTSLIAHIERFFAGLGFSEIGSDALLENSVSHAAHAAWGFIETERVVCFRKTPIASGGQGGR